MLAVKAFNDKLQATMGKGIFQFEPGATYEEPVCKCAKNGYHCSENPLCALSYYNAMSSRFFVVEAAGDINQDGEGSRISCTKITLIREITRIQLAVMACRYMERYPDREMESNYAVKNKGECDTAGDFIIVRGKHPVAAGVKGAYLFLIQEAKDSKKIKGIYPIEIDGREYLENRWYGIRGGAVCEKKRCGD